MIGFNMNLKINLLFKKQSIKLLISIKRYRMTIMINNFKIFINLTTTYYMKNSTKKILKAIFINLNFLILSIKDKGKFIIYFKIIFI